MQEQIFKTEPIAYVSPTSRTLGEWLIVYEKELRTRNYQLKTIDGKLSMMKRLNVALGETKLCSVKPKDIQSFIQVFIAKEQFCSAKNARVLLSDLFREAVLQEWVTSNPVVHVRPHKVPVLRARLLMHEWLRIYNAASVFCLPYVHYSMLLSLVTGQRRADISNMRRRAVFDGHLHIVQQETGQKVALPINLYCSELNITLSEVLAYCPGNDFVLGHRQVMPWSLSEGFRAAREIAYPAEWSTPPSFHEQRSLSERIYRDQGVNTMRLLGHKTQKATDRYNDDRGREFRKLVI